MEENAKRDLAAWVQLMGERPIPVLRQTVRSLEDARLRIDNVNGREVADIVQRDPLMAVRVLIAAQPLHAKRQMKEVATIDQAVMMMGVEPFFRHFEQLDVVEDLLKPFPQALLGLLFIVRRAQRAARFAYEWAVWRRSAQIEEIYTSALLYDLAEIMMWIHSPQESAHILTMQKADSTLRSVVAQQNVFGFRFTELQQMLCKVWQLPELALYRFHPELQNKPNFLNVKLAVDLARHSAKGWDNAALPDDFTAIEQLLNINYETLMYRLGLNEPGFKPNH
ncbi:MAG: putative signal transduction protein [Burkholderiaceae bacterium]|nr:putative signal transduction protein [Burkholderiaceae bacterium]